MPQKCYVPIAKLGRDEFAHIIDGGDKERIAAAILSISYWDNEWAWIESQLLLFAADPDCKVLWAVATGFSHQAVFHGEANLDSVYPALESMKEVVSKNGCAGSLAGQQAILNAIADTVEDLDFFVSQRRHDPDIELGQRLPADG